MVELFNAIRFKFDTTASLRTIFPTGIYTAMAPRNSALPVCVVKIPLNKPEYNTGSEMLNYYNVRFQIFAEDGDTAVAGVEAVKAAFNHKGLSVSGGTSIRFSLTDEDIDVDDENVFNANVAFECVLQTTIS